MATKLCRCSEGECLLHPNSKPEQCGLSGLIEAQFIRAEYPELPEIEQYGAVLAIDYNLPDGTAKLIAERVMRMFINNRKAQLREVTMEGERGYGCAVHISTANVKTQEEAESIAGLMFPELKVKR